MPESITSSIAMKRVGDELDLGATVLFRWQLGAKEVEEAENITTVAVSGTWCHWVSGVQ